MPTHASSLSQIEKLKAEIAALQNQALAELTQRRKGIEEELQEIDQQLVQLNGGPKERKPKFPTPAQLVSLAELKPMLAGAPGKTISTRRENLDLRNIRLLTDQNPGLLKMGGSGAWPLEAIEVLEGRREIGVGTMRGRWIYTLLHLAP